MPYKPSSSSSPTI